MFKSRLYEPGLNCPNCHYIYVKNNKKPACLANRCSIVDIAGDKGLNKLVDAFINIEVLDMSSGYGRFQEKILQESGLIEESAATILEMKSIIGEYRAWKEKSTSKKTR